MLPVTSLNGLPIGNGGVGEIFKKLLDLWSQNTQVNIAAQIQKWDSERPKKSDDNAPTPYSFSKK